MSLQRMQRPKPPCRLTVNGIKPKPTRVDLVFNSQGGADVVPSPNGAYRIVYVMTLCVVRDLPDTEEWLEASFKRIVTLFPDGKFHAVQTRCSGYVPTAI